MASRLIFISILLVFLLQGCAVTAKVNGDKNQLSKQDFAQYVEAVFRLQNNVTSELMSLQAEDEEVDQSLLLKAEQPMREACAPLNSYVSKEMEGTGTGFFTKVFLKNKIEKSAIECERCANEVRFLLKN